MLLLLTLLYLFHGFQTHASPHTSLLAESLTSSNTTVLSTPACICPADQRSLWNILWSCLATIFACSWVSIHPNIPGPDESRWRIFLLRLELMFWAVVGPEMIITWALRQWFGARNLNNLYKDRGWTKAHGYFILMGGFILFEGNTPKGVLSPEKFSELLMAGKIEFPTVTVEEIEDRSKADGFSKTIALGQTLWFVAQCISRRAQHLDLTLIELLTLSLAVLNGLMYFLWWHKPLDVRCPVHVYLLDAPNDSNEPDVPIFDRPKPLDFRCPVRVYLLDVPNDSNVSDVPILDHPVYSWLQDRFTDISRKISDWRRKITIIWQPLPILSKVLILIPSTIMIPFLLALTFSILVTLVFVIPGLFLCNRWAEILDTDHFNIGDMKVPTFYSIKNERDGLGFIVCFPVVGGVFGGIHCVGWFFTFPSTDEAMLWRVCSAVLTGSAILLPFLIVLLLEIGLEDNRWGNHFLSLVSTIVILYVVSRLLLIVEAFISLRHLTPGMLALVKWTSFIPHI